MEFGMSTLKVSPIGNLIVIILDLLVLSIERIGTPSLLSIAVGPRNSFKRKLFLIRIES